MAQDVAKWVVEKGRRNYGHVILDDWNASGFVLESIWTAVLSQVFKGNEVIVQRAAWPHVSYECVEVRFRHKQVFI